MKVEIISRAGQCHDFDPQKNEDAVSSLVGERYAFFCISDGAGSSQYAKDAAWTTVNTVIKCCNDYGSELFESETDIAQKRLILDIQQNLYNKAKELSTELSEMMCTLVLLCLDKENKKYVTMHIGDGLIAKRIGKEVEIISYPENGITKQYTYFVNSPNVFKHLRICQCRIVSSESFFVATDGCFEGCNNKNKYVQKIKAIDSSQQHQDDSTYCKVKQIMIQ